MGYMRVIADAFGGDNAPLEILKGCALAVEELGIDITVVGDEAIIKKVMTENGISDKNITVHHAADVFTMDRNPISIRHKDNETSMAVGLRMLKAGEGDAFVSAGSTGALVVGGTFIVKRIKGVKKAAIGSVMPSDKGPFMLLDSGANIDCTPDNLVLFAVMGSLYMNKLMGIENPRVGLANIGTEENKGTPLCVDSYKALQNAPVNFIGNAEVRDIPFGAADVIVTDGFTGNVILKMYEGVASALLGNIKKIFTASLVSKLSYLGIKGGMGEFKKKMDYKEFGGAPLMGLTMPVIKAHGSSDARTFKNAVRQAVRFSEQGVIDEIIASLGGVSDEDEAQEEN